MTVARKQLISVSEYAYSPVDCHLLKDLDTEAAQEAIAAWKVSIRD